MAWIQTFIGKKFSLDNPDPALIDIVDIAHALSLLCRFNGHCTMFYPVAEHSVHVAVKLPPNRPWLGCCTMWRKPICDVPRR